MNRILMFFVAALMLLSLSAAPAMEIRQFDKMAAQDRQDYMNLLVEGAQKVLIDDGKRDLAAKVYQLFHEIPAGASISIGEAEFEGNLDNARVADAKRHAGDPKASRLEVEDALAVTLQNNHIELPDGFFAVAKYFKPKYSEPTKQK